MPIYGADGNTLTEGSTGVKFVNIATAGVLSENTSQVYAIKNPLGYIINTTAPQDWYTNNQTHQNNALWIENIKSDYDPCPQGWQIPTDSRLTYGDFSTTTFLVSGSETNVANGRIYNNMTWFPAGGCRTYNSGVLSYMGTRGYYWSLTVSNTNAQRLYFNLNDIYSNTTNGRAYGFSVRCVQE